MNNNVELTQVENSFKIKETSIEDNHDNAEIVISTKTGTTKNELIIIIALLVFLGMFLWTLPKNRRISF